jgi:hypothetical protein
MYSIPGRTLRAFLSARLASNSTCASPFSQAEKHDFRCFAEVVARRTNEVAHIFDKKARPTKPEFVQMTINHARVEVAGSAGHDLAYGNHALVLACGNSLRGDDGLVSCGARFLHAGFCDPRTEILASQQWTRELAEPIRRADLFPCLPAAFVFSRSLR